MTQSVTDIQTFLNKMLDRVDGLQAIVVSDRDGVVLWQAANPNLDPSISQKLTDTSLAVTFGIATEQANKLQLGPNGSITTIYDNYIFVHVNLLPLVVTIVGTLQDGCAGALLNLIPALKSALDNIRYTIDIES
eukprot:TRINITY_DN9675_c0_g1::TRINITY_DN9675_c0_g1_i1::g.10161::m.10161 TRINITY_DN9675_c0_g1::TRINITY_DN9675_c0_g1_i1::g.10161  ORF type:complete len:134 (-),score=17.96,sp/Q7T0T2/LTR3B_XENLA/38.40/6e-18,MAPKK1_Int/PF08923.5/1.4e-27 TRINITY_DN9675_c0_g1_i1:5-406(-)